MPKIGDLVGGERNAVEVSCGFALCCCRFTTSRERGRHTFTGQKTQPQSFSHPHSLSVSPAASRLSTFATKVKTDGLAGRKVKVRACLHLPHGQQPNDGNDTREKERSLPPPPSLPLPLISPFSFRTFSQEASASEPVSQKLVSPLPHLLPQRLTRRRCCCLRRPLPLASLCVCVKKPLAHPGRSALD